MMAINGYRVITFFKVSDIYLTDTAKKIFRKFPKMDFLNFFLILPPTILLHRIESTDKTHCFKASLAKYITDLMPKTSLSRPSP